MTVFGRELTDSSMSGSDRPLEVIDFHGHWFPRELVHPRPTSDLPPAVRNSWPLLLDLGAQLEAAEAAGTDIKVICAPLSSLRGPASVPVAELPTRTNEALAAAVAEYGPRVAALATVDAYAGERGAEEARRAIDELGLAGIVVDAASGETLLSDPSARPTLEYAAERGITVFAHPVNPPYLPPRYASQSAGVWLARGSESALSTLALLESGVFDQLPRLEVVLAGIAGAALLLAGVLDPVERAPGERGAGRERLYIDTMGFDPAAIGFAVDVLGPSHVLVGSDWPIMGREPARTQVEESLAAAGLSFDERELIASGNARRLLGLPAARGLTSKVGRRLDQRSLRRRLDQRSARADAGAAGDLLIQATVAGVPLGASSNRCASASGSRSTNVSSSTGPSRKPLSASSAIWDSRPASRSSSRVTSSCCANAGEYARSTSSSAVPTSAAMIRRASSGCDFAHSAALQRTREHPRDDVRPLIEQVSGDRQRVRDAVVDPQ